MPAKLNQPSTAVGKGIPGDEAGFTALVRQHQGMVYGLARHVLGHAADAEDVAQEVFLALYRHRARIESEAHLNHWLRAVTARKCIDWRRRKRPLVELFESDAAAGACAREDCVEPRLRTLLASLAPPARLALVLRYQEDLNPREIASTLKMPLATVKSHLRRGLDRLRQGLAQKKEDRRV